MQAQIVSLLEDVQKYILTKPRGQNLYVSEEVFSFFTKDRPHFENKPLPPVPSIPQKFTPYQKPPPEKVVLPPQVKESLPEEESPLFNKAPSYDFNALKDMVAHIKPDLKILHEEPSLKKGPHCLILGLGTQDELEMMENIQKAIIGTLKKEALIVSVAKTKEEYKAFFQKKNVQLSIVSLELLENTPHIKELFKGGAGEVGYIHAVPTASTPTFRGLKDNPAEKRLLWNTIKTILAP